MTTLGAYLFVDLFVAIILSVACLHACHEAGQPLYPVATLLVCMLWPISLLAWGILSVYERFAEWGRA